MENNQSTRDYLVEGLSGMTDEMLVLSAGDGEEAARILAARPVDILVTELVMPVMDGFELLNYVLEEHPGLEIVVMGETSLGRASQALCAAGEFRFMSKPVVVQNLIDVVRSILARPALGRLTGLSLPGFLQLLGAENRTCSLRVKSLGHEGRVDVKDGRLINATCRGAEGKEALFEILSWSKPEIEVEEPRETVAGLIADQLPSLLLEAALMHDKAITVSHRGSGSLREPRTGATELDQKNQVVGSFSTFAEVPLQVEVAAAAKGLRSFMRLEGTLGAGIVDSETGRSLAFVCRGRKSYFARLAAEAARAVRDGMLKISDAGLTNSVRQLKLPGQKQFQLIRMVRAQPQLMLVFAGLEGRTNVAEASTLLADFETMIADSSRTAAAQPGRAG